MVNNPFIRLMDCVSTRTCSLEDLVAKVNKTGTRHTNPHFQAQVQFTHQRLASYHWAGLLSDPTDVHTISGKTSSALMTEDIRHDRTRQT